MTRNFLRLRLPESVLFTAPVAILLLFPSPWMALGFTAVMVLGAISWTIGGMPIAPSRANGPLFVLLLAIVVGFAHSSTPDSAVILLGQVVAGVLAFYTLLDRTHTPSDLWWAATVITILGILLALAAPFTVQWTSGKIPGLAEFYMRPWPKLSKITNPNILAGGIAPIVPIGLALLADRRSWRLVGAVSLAPLLFTLILLQSRGALLSLGLGLVIWLALVRRWLVPVMAVMFFIALYFVSLSPGWVGQFFNTYTLMQRRDIWFQAVQLITQAPLAGIGLGSYPQIAPYAWPHSISQPGLMEPHADNMFLQVALDTGIPGMAAFIVLLAVAFHTLWHAYQAGVEPRLAMATLMALLVVVFHGLGDTIVWDAKPSIVLWMLLGLAFSFERIVRMHPGSHEEDSP